MSAPTQDSTSAPATSAGRDLLIVARDQGDLYDALWHAYADSAELAVLVDRRQTERRRECQPVAGERRQRDRRDLPSLVHDLRFQQYVLVRPPRRRSVD